VNSSALVTAEVPDGVVTVMFTVPWPGGLVTVICVPVSAVIVVQPDDVHVVQGGQHFRLTAEHLGELRVGPEMTTHVLDRDQGAGRVVPGQHHITGSARAQRLHFGITGDIPVLHADRPLSR
jgi:hypothetical protein